MSSRAKTKARKERQRAAVLVEKYYRAHQQEFLAATDNWALSGDREPVEKLFREALASLNLPASDDKDAIARWLSDNLIADYVERLPGHAEEMEKLETLFMNMGNIAKRILEDEATAAGREVGELSDVEFLEGDIP